MDYMGSDLSSRARAFCFFLAALASEDDVLEDEEDEWRHDLQPDSQYGHEYGFEVDC